MMSATAFSQLPFHLPNNTLQLRVSGLAIQEEVEKVKPEIMQYLRSQLNNRNITLHVVLDSDKTTKLLYTNREKLDYLLEKYPNLAKLRDRLDLEADF